MPDAAARILIDGVDELLDRVLTVSIHVTGLALRGSDEFAIDDEQAMIESFDETFDNDRAPVLPRLFERDFDFLGRL